MIWFLAYSSTYQSVKRRGYLFCVQPVQNFAAAYHGGISRRHSRPQIGVGGCYELVFGEVCQSDSMNPTLRQRRTIRFWVHYTTPHLIMSIIFTFGKYFLTLSFVIALAYFQ